MAPIDLDSAMGSTTTSTDSQNNNDDSDEYDNVREVARNIGADVESAVAYCRNNGGNAEENLIELAEDIAESGELEAKHEEYRQWNCINRIIQVHLRSHSDDFSDWTAQFYGDYEDPEGDTFNYVQQTSRDMGCNLPIYKALFPEPQAEYWDSDVVLWQERPDEDSHIYVSQSFVDDYAQFARDIDGQSRPVPPSNDELAELAQNNDAGNAEGGEIEDVAAPFDPSDMTIEDLEEAIDRMKLTNDELWALKDKEEAGKDRVGAVDAIARATDDNPHDEPDDDRSAQEMAHDIIEKHGLEMPAVAVESMISTGMTEDEIVEKCA